MRELDPRKRLAASKVLITKALLRAACDHQLTARAHAVLAQYCIDSFPRRFRDRSLWCAKLSRETLANRLACSCGSIDRAIDELKAANLIRQTRAFNAIAETALNPNPVRAGAESQSAPVMTAVSARDDSESAPALTYSVSQ